jgi:hypothetical protein
VLQVIDNRRAVSSASPSAHRPPHRAAATGTDGAASEPDSGAQGHVDARAVQHRDAARDDRETADGPAAAASSAAVAPAGPSASANAAHDEERALRSAVISPAAGSPASSPPAFASASATNEAAGPQAADEGAAAASAVPPTSSASASADATTPSPPHEIWPPSTRLSYTLTGNYRGAIGGTARVQWVRIGAHYQVQMDVIVGLPFAPLMTRRVTSDGEITEAGLQPSQFDELTKRAFQEPSHTAIHFADNLARMSNGLVVPAPAGTQDSASQFVQLTWLFTLHPELLQPGHSISFPLALRGRVQPWTYDVLDTDSLYTVFGDVPVVHVKPRPVPGLRNVLGIEIWFAPTLQYLPARILVRENADTYIDLVLRELPLQAAPSAPAFSSGGVAHEPAGSRPSRRRSL